MDVRDEDAALTGARVDVDVRLGSLALGTARSHEERVQTIVEYQRKSSLAFLTCAAACYGSSPTSTGDPDDDDDDDDASDWRKRGYFLPAAASRPLLDAPKSEEHLIASSSPTDLCPLPASQRVVRGWRASPAGGSVIFAVYD